MIFLNPTFFDKVELEENVTYFVYKNNDIFKEKFISLDKNKINFETFSLEIDPSSGNIIEAKNANFYIFKKFNEKVLFSIIEDLKKTELSFIDKISLISSITELAKLNITKDT